MENGRGLRIGRWVATGLILAVVAVGSWLMAGRAKAANDFTKMAPLEKYLMGREAEIALARSAAPASISGAAEVLVLGKQGYETAVKGTNGFVCVVERGWAAGKDDPDYWSPNLRGPMCFNPTAAKTEVPEVKKRTELVLKDPNKETIFAGLKAAMEKKELRAPETGAMCYMLSKDGYLSETGKHWRPHLMFFLPYTEPAEWGAGAEGSPIIAFADRGEDRTVFIVPVMMWSDGTPAPPMH